EEEQEQAAKCYDSLKERIFRDEMLQKHRRPDGRAFDQVRPITIETGVLPRVHGSALFTRGETQALVTVTLGTKDDEQRIELLEPGRSEEHTSELQSPCNLACRLLLEKKNLKGHAVILVSQ